MISGFSKWNPCSNENNTLIFILHGRLYIRKDLRSEVNGSFFPSSSRLRRAHRSPAKKKPQARQSFFFFCFVLDVCFALLCLAWLWYDTDTVLDNTRQNRTTLVPARRKREGGSKPGGDGKKGDARTIARRLSAKKPHHSQPDRSDATRQRTRACLAASYRSSAATYPG